MTDENTPPADIYLERVAEIVAAYVSHNQLPSSELPSMIHSVYAALSGSGNGSATSEVAARKEPAVSIKKSVTPDYIICLEDGKKFQSLKRHLRSAYSMTPEEYRAKWGLPFDYPMVAPNYAQKRSQLAMSMGLGKKQPKAAKARTKRS